MKIRRLILLLAMAPVTLWAQDSIQTGSDGRVPETLLASQGAHDMPRTHAYMLGVGAANVLDTYISPEKYKGLALRYITTAVRPSRRYTHITYHTVHQGEIDYVHNRADNNNEIGGLYNFQYAVHYNWSMSEGRLQLHGGAGLDASIGFLYNTRNSNNPAQARLELNVAPSAGARYGFQIGQRSCFLNYDIMMPLAGVMFSPNYGQSYYEIFSEGNYDHNAVPTTIVSKPSMRQMLSLDFPIGHTWMRLGYQGDYQQAHVNGLKYHNYAHLLVIGFVTHFTINRYRP